jgi:long-chain acyl-CoA synthetase
MDDKGMFRHTLVNHFLEYSAYRRPDKVALIHQGERFTYGQINVMADRLALALRESGVERGDRIAVFMDNSTEAVVSLFGIMKADAAFMMINHTTKCEKLEYILNNSRAKILITQGGRAEIIAKINCPSLKTVIATGPRDSLSSTLSYDDIVNSNISAGPLRTSCIDLDIASIVYTSGSTGNPKGVTLSHLNMVSAAHSITTYLENSEDDIILNTLPLTFDYGLYQILMGFRIGGTVVLEKSFTYPAQVLKTMVEEKVTGFPGVPTIFAMLLQMKDIEKYDFSSLRYITNTAAALPVSHIRRLRELVPQARLYSMYGLTECKRVSYLPPEELDRRPTSVGKGMPNEEIFVVDETGSRVGPGIVGELVVRGSNVMLGYWEMPEETAKCLRPGKYSGERYLYTGDLFKIDDEGFFYFVARKDDIIKCKGEKVSPKEVENVLYGFDGVVEAAVVGVPDEIFGQAVKAYVTLEKGSSLTERDILKFCSQHLENFMMPKYVEFRDFLPKTATGKISKKDLAAVDS